ncbi:MAG: thiamine pyrophosphate-dependent enzyme, partial [Gemmobacter sp.]
NRYRTKEEIEDWMARDPIARFRAELIAHGILDESGADAIAQAAVDDVQQGIEFAKASPAPAVTELTRYVHAEA